jgi:hypothetical protein
MTAECPVPATVIEDRITYLLTQYRESPKLIAVLRNAMREAAVLAQLICEIPDFFDLDTAVGDQLTIIGKWLGWPRCHCNGRLQTFAGIECEVYSNIIIIDDFDGKAIVENFASGIDCGEPTLDYIVGGLCDETPLICEEDSDSATLVPTPVGDLPLASGINCTQPVPIGGICDGSVLVCLDQTIGAAIGNYSGALPCELPLHPIGGLCDGATLSCGSPEWVDYCIDDDELYRRFLKAYVLQLQGDYRRVTLIKCLQDFFGTPSHIIYERPGVVVASAGKIMSVDERATLHLIIRAMPVAPGVRLEIQNQLPDSPFAGIGEGWGGLCDGMNAALAA